MHPRRYGGGYHVLLLGCLLVWVCSATKDWICGAVDALLWYALNAMFAVLRAFRGRAAAAAAALPPASVAFSPLKQPTTLYTAKGGVARVGYVERTRQYWTYCRNKPG